MIKITQKYGNSKRENYAMRLHLKHFFDLIQRDIKDLVHIFGGRWNIDTKSGNNDILTFDYFQDIDLIMASFDLNKSWLCFNGWMETQILEKTALGKRCGFRTFKVPNKNKKEYDYAYEKSMREKYYLENDDKISPQITDLERYLMSLERGQ